MGLSDLKKFTKWLYLFPPPKKKITGKILKLKDLHGHHN